MWIHQIQESTSLFLLKNGQVRCLRIHPFGFDCEEHPWISKGKLRMPVIFLNQQSRVRSSSIRTRMGMIRCGRKEVVASSSSIYMGFLCMQNRLYNHHVCHGWWCRFSHHPKRKQRISLRHIGRCFYSLFLQGISLQAIKECSFLLILIPYLGFLTIH